jgi:RHS repeat-associated protein
VYEYDGTNWFRVTYQTQAVGGGYYATNTIRERLSGFTSSTVLTDAQIIDPDANTNYVTVTLAFATKKVTAVTNTPQSTINITAVTINSLLQTLTSESISTPTWHYYDALGRETAVKDPLGFVSGTAYSPTNTWVFATTNAAGKVTSYEYYGMAETNAGKIKSITQPNGKKSSYAYTLRGEMWRTWGDVPFPQERAYNGYGEMTELRTYRAGSGWNGASWPSGSTGTADTTSWNYDATTGLLLAKTDALGRSVTNNYLFTRTHWTAHSARGVVVTNTYDEFGEIVRKDYSDGTVSVVYDGGRSALGEPIWLTDATGTRYFEYDTTGKLLAVHWTTETLAGLGVTNRYDQVYGRDRLVLDGLATPLVQDYRIHTGTGRLNVVSNGIYSVTYAYLANSDLIQTTTCKSNTTTVLTGTRTWNFGYRLSSIQNTVGGSPITGHTYLYDEIDRRTQATLADGSYWSYTYDDRNEVTSGKRYWADFTPVPGQHFEYGFDTIGNRTEAKTGGDAYGAGLLPASYTNNALNQLMGRSVPSYVDIVGAATALATNVSVNSQVADYRSSEYYWKKLAVANSGGPVWPTVTNTAIMSNQTATVTGHLLVPPAGQSFQYDADGNLTNDLDWRYKWDAENRLTEATNVTGLPAEARRKVAFSYDYLGRRSAKWVFAWDSGANNWAANPLVSVRFVYGQPSGQAGSWNLIAELDLIQNPGTPTLVRSYLWGADLSGTFDKAGGVGGLLAITTHASPLNTHFPCFDGNGNVMALVNAADKSVSARYEYGPFGEPIRVTGPLAQTNPFRFSTKLTDEETGLVYYGYRYYAPSLGRWINRDPIEDQGGLNLYVIVSDNPINHFDPMGAEDEEDWDLDIRLAIAAEGSGFVATYAYDTDLMLMHQRVMDEGVETLKTAGREIAIQVGMTVGGGIAGRLIGKALSGVAAAMRKAAPKISSGFSGGRGYELRNLQGTRNTPTTIRGRSFSGHALDQMQNRGIPPSVVLNTIKVGAPTPGKTPGTTEFFDVVNKVMVVINNQTGNVITVMFKSP